MRCRWRRWPWRAPASTGSRSSTCWRPTTASSWSMPSICRRCQDGRATSRRARWLAELLSHGLLKASFIPPQPIRALRELTRYRKTLVQERQQEVNRLHKVLESANIKLGAVASDVLGASGRDMLAALLAGEQDAAAMAELARGRLRAKLPALRQALEGRMTGQ